MSYPLERGTFSITQFLMGGGNVPKQRYQTIGSGLKQNKNGSWFIRPWVDIITADGLARVRRRIVLGPASIGKREATRLANEALAKINNASYVIQSQIALEDFAREYTKRHIRKISYSTQCKYDIHLKRIVGVFGKLMLCEITTPKIEDWIDSLKLSWATRTDIRNVFSSVFTKGRRLGDLERAQPGRGGFDRAQTHRSRED